MEIENKLNTLLKDNQTLETNLQQLKDGMSDNNSSGAKSTQSSSELEMKIKLITLENERDQLRWNQEKQSLQTEISKYQEIIKAKEAEYLSKDMRDQQLLKDEI